MATKKSKGGKDADRKLSKKVVEEEVINVVEIPKEVEEPVAVAEEASVETLQTVSEPEPEPVYEEPILTQLIVLCYEGDKVKGLYDGMGRADFVTGNHYEGEFSQGYMHGLGTYTWADGVMYEGQITWNTLTGKGKYTWTDGSTYEGDVVDGLRHGQGTLISARYGTIYKGEWSRGKINGKGRLDFDCEGQSYYDGQWVDNIRHGFGVLRYPSGNIYEGMWYKNMRHGLGTMQWFDQNQSYTGNWENGIQHGMGVQVWYLRRGTTSQYPLRNTYDGHLCRGMRHGFGIFHYANGARYEGEWHCNVKCGKGKFIFKNGRVYEGMFENDHITEFPGFEMDSLTTPDICAVRTRTPLPCEMLPDCGHESVNTFSPGFRLDVDHLFTEIAEPDQDEEGIQLTNVLLRHMTSLHRVYAYYSRLGHEVNPDNAFVMTRMQFWRMLKDCGMHYYDYGLTDMDRWLARTPDRFEEFHNPYHQLLFREFLDYLVVLAFHLYRDQYPCCPVLAQCMSQLISENILKHACCVRGYMYRESRKAVCAIVHMNEAFSVYCSLRTLRKRPPFDWVLTMRQFLFALKDMGLIDEHLTVKTFVDILADDDPKVRDEYGSINLELEMNFLDFFETLLGCAQSYVTEDKLLTTVLKPEVTGVVDENLLQSSVLLLRLKSPSQMSGEQLNESLRTLNSPLNINSPVSVPVIKDQSGNEISLMSLQKVSDSKMMSLQNVSDSKMMSLQNVSESKLPEPSEEILDQVDEQSEATAATEVDEATRLFNMWTHKIYVFLVRKFFPAAHRLLTVRERLKKDAEQAARDAECMKNIQMQLWPRDDVH